MPKIIKNIIYDCTECPFYFEDHSRPGIIRYKCLEEQKVLKDPEIIPEWCPLNDEMDKHCAKKNKKLSIFP